MADENNAQPAGGDESVSGGVAASPFMRRLAEPRVVIGDGALGTMLYSRGIPGSACFDECNLSHPRVVLDIHQAYMQAGAEVIETNTYGANRFKLDTYDLAAKVKQINMRGAKLARDAREIVGLPVFVAGAIGPLGRPVEPLGRISLTEARDIFREQIDALVEGGVDLLMFETFKDLREMLEAIRAAREACDFPIVAQMSFEEDGLTLVGNTPMEVVTILQQAGAHVVGSNCSTGPARMSAVLGSMKQHAEVPLSFQPNAGWPESVGGRAVYVASPQYMAGYSTRMLELGVRLIGGCCGTTPEHTRAMVEAIRAREQEILGLPAAAPSSAAGTNGASAATRVSEPLLIESVRDLEDIDTAAHDLEMTIPNVAPPSPASARAGAKPGTLAWKLGRQLITTVELAPPRGVNPAKVLAGARMLWERGVDAVDVFDGARGRAAMSMVAVSNMILQQVGTEVIMHFTTRDRSLLGIQAELLGAHAMGHRIVLALTGDPPNPVDKIGSSGVFDIDSIGLIKMMRQMNAGFDVAGNSIGGNTAFLIGCAFDPNAKDLPLEIERLHAKMEAGADFVMTQPFFDVELLDATLDLVKSFQLPILMGILPLQNGRHAEFLHNEVPGIKIPEWARKRMHEAGNNGIDEGIKMARELLAYAHSKVAGAYLMPSFGRYEVCARVLEGTVPPRLRD